MVVNKGLFINVCKKLQKYPSYLENNTKEIGIIQGIQRYRCNDCDKKFHSKRRPKIYKLSSSKSMFIEGKIFQHLAKDYHHSIPWIRKQIFKYEAVVIVCDATFYGKKKDKIGTLVFKDILSKELLICKHV